MHVPPENLFRYRVYMGIYRTLQSLGSRVSGLNGEQGMKDANVLWAMSSRYKKLAQELRVAPEPKLDQRTRQRMRPPIRRPNE